MAKKAQSGGVSIGDVYGGIRDSIIAGRDVHVRHALPAEQVVGLVRR